MKKVLSVFLACVMLLTFSPLSGVADLLDNLIVANAKEVFNEGYCGDTSSGTDGSNLKWNLDSDGVLTITGSGKMADTDEFQNDLRIKKITFSEGVTYIGVKAFYGCKNVESFNLPESLEKIGFGAFCQNELVEEVVVPDKITTLDAITFSECKKLSKVVLPYGLKRIEHGVFSYCTALKNVEVPDTVEYIGRAAFAYTGLTDFKFPPLVKNIVLDTFRGTYISDIVIPGNIKTIDSFAYYGMKAPINSITIEEGVESISYNCFTSSRNDNTITELVLPDSLVTLGYDTLYDESAISIDSIEKIVIGKSLKEIYNAFPDNSNIKTIEIDEENTYLHQYDNAIYNADYSELLWVNKKGRTKLTFPKELKGFNCDYEFTGTSRNYIKEYAIEDGAENFTVVDGVLYTKDMKVLYRCPMKKDGKVVIPDTVETIRKYAFVLTDVDVEFSEGLKNIETCAFKNTTHNGELVLPSSVEKIGNRAFYNCHYTSVVLSDNLETLNDTVFSNSTYLYSVHIGAKTHFDSDGQVVFGRETREITISSENPYYSSYKGSIFNKGYDTFIYAPPKAETVTIPKETKTFSKYPASTVAIVVDNENPYYKSNDVFLMNHDGTHLYRIQDKYEKVVLPYGVKTADNTAFSNDNLKNYCKSLTFPEGFEKIILAPNTFAGFYLMSQLEELNFPGTMKVIPQIYHCYKLKKVTLGEGVEEVQGFWYCRPITELELPKSCKYCAIGYSNSSYDSFVNKYVDSTIRKLIVNNPNCEIKSVDYLSPECTVYGYCGSPAHKAAVKRNSKFVSLGHEYLDWYTFTPATYENEGEERRDCSYCDEWESRVIPKLKQETHKATFVADGKVVSVVEFYDTMTSIEEPQVPVKDRYLGEWESYTLGDKDITINAKYTLIKSENAENVKAESKVEHYYDTDDVLFTLKASAKAKTVKSVISKSVGLDIVLVVDQSGSMDKCLGTKQKKVDALKESASEFVESVANNAKLTGTNHRIAIVGFGIVGDYPGFSRNENTELLTTASGEPIVYDKITPENYAAAMQNVLTSNSINPNITKAISSIEAKGATATDRGLEMVKGIYANTDSSDRERVVVFMTDGEPTYANKFDMAVANSTIANADILKSAYNATIYSVGIFDDYQSDNRRVSEFMNAVSSNYPNARSIGNLGKKQSSDYFIKVGNTASLSSVFKTITIESFSHTASFDKLTFVKTLSKYVTLTSKQEQELRVSLIRKYSISDDDIIIKRNDDSTTLIMVKNLSPYEVENKDGTFSYEVSMSFFASLNENAVKSGTYSVDTEDSGVMLGDTNGYEAVFEPSSITLESDKKRFVFTVNNEVYDITEGNSADKCVPETDFSSDCRFTPWDTANASKENGTVLNATLEKLNRKIVWHTGEKDIVQYYKENDVILAPTISKNEGGMSFLSWNKSVPTVMPGYDLEFNAVYGEHIHKEISKVVKTATCTEKGLIKTFCDCGQTNTKEIPATGHDFEVVTPPTQSESSKCTFVCKNCGLKYDYALNYEIISATGWHSRVLYEFQLTNDELETGFEPDEAIYIKIPLSKFQGSAPRANVYRLNEDGSKTFVPSKMENGYLIVEANHFSKYDISFDFECTKTGEHIDENGDGYCDYCNIEYKSDNDALIAAIEKSNQYSKEDYSETSLNNLNNIVDEYYELSSSNALQSEYDGATAEILTAITELQPYLICNIAAENGNVNIRYSDSKKVRGKDYVLYGSTVTLSATADKGYKFIGWYDTVNNLYFSKNPDYIFKVTANTSLKAVFAKNDTATLTFTTYSNWIQTSVTKTIDEWISVDSIDNFLPQVPYRYGYSNGRWVYNNSDILAKLQTGEDVSLIPEYDEDDTSLPTPMPSKDGIPSLDLYYKFDANAGVGSFVMAAGIDEECKVESVGIAFYYKDKDIFNPADFDLLLNNKMLIGRFNTDELQDVYIVDMHNMTDKYNWAARGYVSYYDNEGNLKTAYSNQINIVNKEQV